MQGKNADIRTERRRYSIPERILVLFNPNIYLMLLIYLFILLPLALAMVLLGREADLVLGWTFLPGYPWNVILFLLFFIPSGILWTWTYSYLVLDADGSPTPLLKQTSHLVTDGPYSWSRNPSIIAKSGGVIALALLFRSPFFLLVMFPLLLGGSLIEKRWRQEPVLVRVFGDHYIRYRDRTPILFPCRFRGRGSVDGADT